MSTEGCAPDMATEELLALLDMVAQEQEQHLRALTEQRSDAERTLRAIDSELGALEHWADFTNTLRRQVEAGRMAAQAALVELVPRRFSTSDFVSKLHEFTPPKRRAS